MSECPDCGMRDDDWFLCRREQCAIKAAEAEREELVRLRAENERLTKELAEARAKFRDDLAKCLISEVAAEARAEKAVTLLTKASVALEQFAAIGDMLTLAGAASEDEIELSGEDLRPALLAAAIVKKEIDASLPKESADA